MARLVRCDQCNRLSDEKGVGYIGRNFEVRFYKDLVLAIKTMKDYCGDCVKKIVATYHVGEANDEDL